MQRDDRAPTKPANWEVNRAGYLAARFSRTCTLDPAAERMKSARAGARVYTLQQRRTHVSVCIYSVLGRGRAVKEKRDGNRNGGHPKIARRGVGGGRGGNERNELRAIRIASNVSASAGIISVAKSICNQRCSRRSLLLPLLRSVLLLLLPAVSHASRRGKKSTPCIYHNAIRGEGYRTFK